MITFTGALVILLLGYLFYGAFVERIFGAKADAAMPCDTKRDGVDYMPLPTWRVFLIQFLNIAGTGPMPYCLCMDCLRMHFRRSCA